MALTRKTWCSSSLMRRLLWAPTLLLLFAYLVLHGVSNIFFCDRSVAVVPPAVTRLAPHSIPDGALVVAEEPLKIFMYDLPRKFTYGVIESYCRARGLKDGDLRYPGTQHSAEWSLFSDLQAHAEVASTNRVRVLDPYEADVFYVPFFSSLSLVVNTKKGNEAGVKYDDDEMQEELMSWLEKQDTWKRNGGRDHVVICQDPNALFKLRDRLKTAVLLLSDFGRFRPDQASLVKDVVIPYTHRINSYVVENATLERSTLLFFMGNRYRKEGGKIRDRLFQVLDAEQDMVVTHGTQSRENRRLAAAGMRISKFCLHPAGDTPSACRLFDAIVSVCVPVVVSDDIELPFEDYLDYTEFAVFVSSSKALEPGYLASYLRDISADELEQKQQRLREVRKYFEYGGTGSAAVDMIWEQVKRKLPLMRTLIHRDKRLIAERRISGNCSCVCDQAPTL